MKSLHHTVIASGHVTSAIGIKVRPNDLLDDSRKKEVDNDVNEKQLDEECCLGLSKAGV